MTSRLFAWRMRLSSRAILAIILLTAVSPQVALTQGFASPAPSQCSPLFLAAASHGDIQRVQFSSDVYVERLQGEAALAHLYNLMSRKPEAFATARRSLEERGFSPTNTVYVERTVRLAKNSNSGSDVLPAQSHSEQNNDGEIVFWSWDDGDNRTWEGSIYMEVYASGAASLWEGQIDDSTSQYPWVYYQRVWQGPGGGGPQEVRFRDLPPRPGYYTQAVPAVLTGDMSPRSSYVVVGWMEWAQCWRACVVGSCTTAAIACRLSGPAWPGCWASWCIGAEVGCGITCWLMN